MVAGIIRPSKEERLDILTQAAQYDVCLSSCNSNPEGGAGRVRDSHDSLNAWIYPTALPGQGTMHILKVLQSNFCKNRCSYCAFSAMQKNTARERLGSEELARLFIELYYKKLVQGVFISSGVDDAKGGAMENMIATAEILRKKYYFEGYIHLKLLPGTPQHLIENAALYADRVSLNLEAPGRDFLKAIAPDKNLVDELIPTMQRRASVLRKPGFRAKNQSTQFVIGAGNELDLDILRCVDWIYRKLFVFRSYFSAYQPLEKNLVAREEVSQRLIREHRLYQCDFLLRGYGFRLKDLVFDQSGNLPIHVDPKTAYAIHHPELFPVDVNAASENQLLKVPGIGLRSARRIVKERETTLFRGLNDLKKTGAFVSWAEAYVMFSGKKDSDLTPGYFQRWLFPELNPDSWQSNIKPLGNNEKPDYDYPA
ncbi:MAG: radical SAM protein [Spirochaetales bacterium]|nr:radical SAM protein [Spirochaetales bacterium]